MTDTQPRKIVVAGACVFGDCDCLTRYGLRVDGSEAIPPFHDGCTCYMVEIAGADMTQPKPGRALNEKMAKIMGWATPSQFDATPEYPYVVTIEALGLEKTWVYTDYHTAYVWNPSTRIADAFEVMEQVGWGGWSFIETIPALSVGLAIGDDFTVNLLVPWKDFSNLSGRNRPEAYSFGICWAALVWLEAKE